MVKVVKDGFEIVVTEGAYKNQFAPLGFTIVEDKKVEEKPVVDEKPVVKEEHEEKQEVKPVSKKK